MISRLCVLTAGSFFLAFLCLRRVRERILAATALGARPLPGWRKTVSAVCRRDSLKRIAITLFLLLVVIALRHIALPGIDRAALDAAFRESMKNYTHVAPDTVRSFPVSRISIGALGIMPFLSATTLMVLAGLLVPPFRRLAAANPAARHRVWYGVAVITVFVTCIQAWFFSQALLSPTPLGFPAWTPVVKWSPVQFGISTMVCLTLGTLILVLCTRWIGRYGTGHGVVLYLLVDILSRLPDMARQIPHAVRFSGASHSSLLFCAITAAATFAFAFVCLRLSRRVSLKTEDGEAIVVDIPLSFCGLLPYLYAMGMAAYAAQWLGLWNPVFRSVPPRFAMGAVIVVPLTVLYSRFLFRSRLGVKRLTVNGNAIDKSAAGRELRRASVQCALLWGIAALVCKQMPAAMADGFGIPYLLSGLPYFVASAAVLGLIQFVSRYGEGLKVVYTHSEPLEMICARAHLARNGIQADIHDDDVYGPLHGHFIGPLATRRLLVSPEDYARAANLLEEYNMCKAILPRGDN